MENNLNSAEDRKKAILEALQTVDAEEKEKLIQALAAEYRKTFKGKFPSDIVNAFNGELDSVEDQIKNTMPMLGKALLQKINEIWGRVFHLLDIVKEDEEQPSLRNISKPKLN